MRRALDSLRGVLLAPFRYLAAAVLWLFSRRRSSNDESRRAGVPPEPVELETGPRRRAENVVLLFLLGAVLGAAGFIVFYTTFLDTQLMGLSLGLAFACLAGAAIVAGKAVVPQETAVEERPPHARPEEQKEVEGIVRESGQGISRRRLMIGAAGAAGASVGAASLFPAASFGPRVEETVYRTAWTRGRRVVDEENRPVTAEDVTFTSFVLGFPEGASKTELGSSLIIVRVDPDALQLAPERRAGAPEGIVAFSKICPHAGCAVSILQEPLYAEISPPKALVCPCHYSTFDAAKGGKVLFGPAGRDLPQLPLEIVTDRTLAAAGDFYDPVGPSYGGIRLEG